VPLGPGYTVERQRIEVAFVAAPQPRVSVRATWSVKNSGSRPLATLEVKLPDASTHGRRGLRVESGGSARTAAPAEAGNMVSIALDPPLDARSKREIAVSYDLAGAAGAGGGIAMEESAFVLPPGAWAPALLPPKGTFSSGGAPPEKWEMTVRVPAGFRVHASGREHGRKQEANTVVFRWDERREGQPAFVTGGAYQEKRMAAAGGDVVFWTRQAMPAGLAQNAVAAVARTAAFYDAKFGPREQGARTIWVMQCPSKEPCWPVPQTALMDAWITAQELGLAGQYALDFQLAFSWLDFRVHPDWDAEPLPMGALGDYAAELATAAEQGGDARRRIVQGLATSFSQRKIPEGQKPILNVRLSDSGLVRQYATAKSELFLFALEDAVGTDNVQRAIVHLLGAYRGRTWRAADLRAAVEQESGKDCAALFREWLSGTEIPAEFLSRYGAGAAAATGTAPRSAGPRIGTATPGIERAR